MTTAEEIRRGRPMSPCISICALDHTGHCAGCLRTREEIGSWIRMSPEAQWDLIRELEQRRVMRLPRKSV